MNLLTSSEIKDIRKKYDMSQKEFALAIGIDEITIHRLENGSIQTKSVDSIIKNYIKQNGQKNTFCTVYCTKLTM